MVIVDPKMPRGEMGFLNAMTDAMIITTRLIVLPTAWVIGWTRPSAMNAMYDIETAPVAVAVAKDAPSFVGGSRRSQIGMGQTAEIIVCTANKFVFVIFSPIGCPIAFFARIARKADDTLESIAAPKQSHVNDNSFKLASATPKMIGRSVKY